MDQTLYQRVLKHLVEKLRETNPKNQKERKAFAYNLYGNPYFFAEVFHKENENFTELIKPYKEKLPTVLEELTDELWTDLLNQYFLKLDIANEEKFAEYITDALINRFADIVGFELSHNTVKDLIDYFITENPIQILNIN